MKAILFIVIILAIIFVYALIDQYVPKEFFLGNTKIKEAKPDDEKSFSYSAVSDPKRETETPEPVDSTVSPYIDKVNISRLQKANERNPSVITLRVKPYKGEPINLANFKIKTRKGTFTISQSIIIKEALTVYLVGDTNPLQTGDSFRADKCFGYLSKSKNLYPSFSVRCSAPKLEDLPGLTPYCQDFIIKSSSCKMPDYSSDFKISTDPKCVSYILNYYTYSGCLKRSSKDEDFLSKYWYIYINKNIVEELHDTIFLYDGNDLLVDKYVY